MANVDVPFSALLSNLDERVVPLDHSKMNEESVSRAEDDDGAKACSNDDVIQSSAASLGSPVEDRNSAMAEGHTTANLSRSSVDTNETVTQSNEVWNDESVVSSKSGGEMASIDGHAISAGPADAILTDNNNTSTGGSTSICDGNQDNSPFTIENKGLKKVEIQAGSIAHSNTSVTSLPLDSLHCVASFLSPHEWAGFGLASRATRRVCREVIRRVRLHGFRCATEIVTAWKTGQLADAKELAALYMLAGVPVYPRSLGHSYHTMVWRMGVEIKENEQNEISTEDRSGHGELSATADPFFNERAEFRNREGYGNRVTYLSEKCLYWFDRIPANKFPQRGGYGGFSPNRSPSPASDRRRSSDAPSRPSRFPNLSSPPGAPASIVIKIHEHLLAQHVLGRDFVYDNGGGMVTPPVSLSVDFFHPSSRHGSKHCPLSKEKISLRLPTVAENDVPERRGLFSVGINGDDPLFPPAAPGERLERDDENGLMLNGFLEGIEVDLDNRGVPSGPTNPLSRSKLNEMLGNVEVEVYSASLAGSETSDHGDGSVELGRHLRTRFATYQRRLESFLAQYSYSAFDECLLDFWDEFFPHTAGIHYYDRHTPVPRIGYLKKFLTTPCPKSIGVVQCEIERLKIMSRGKGVNVKGRLFPTYEYRLFIRNRPPNADEGAPTESSTAPRRDTLLMVAKNRGRKHTEASIVAATSASTRKGSNNYYLYLPQQIDVDDHFNEVNDTESPTKLNPNGANSDPVIVSNDSSSVLLGRLQSNFIGTEFQIFTPHHKKRHHARTKSEVASAPPFLEDDIDYDSGMSSDNTSSRRGRFGRLSRRRNVNPNPATADHGSIGSELTTIPSDCHQESSASSRSFVKRTVSCPDLQHRAARPNRRAIANTPDTPKLKEPSLYEEEDGVITYTANLLGSRPRIMDVCIPRVAADGVAGREWKSYLENYDDSNVDECRMLNCFRQLQQRVVDAQHHHQQQQPPDPPNNGPPPVAPPVVANDDGNQRVGEDRELVANPDDALPSVPEDFGLMTLQNRPPWWNVELGSFVLNFGGRVSVASVKNFQLCERTDHDRIMLQFGRIQGRHSFTMDFQHPLSAVQAFSIAISSLQSKISFG
jgi:hypothetical protein